VAQATTLRQREDYILNGTSTSVFRRLYEVRGGRHGSFRSLSVSARLAGAARIEPERVPLEGGR